MGTISAGTMQQLGLPTEKELAAYRYRVFVEGLGWELTDCDGYERDQFDHADTVYVVVRDKCGNICGCARLLPTTAPYLLEVICPELFAGPELPKSSEVWELSRYTTQPSEGEPRPDPLKAKDRFRELLAAVVRTALRHGATRLIAITFVGVERMAKSIGLHIHRAGVPTEVGGRVIVAMWVELDEQTCTALGVHRPS